MYHLLQPKNIMGVHASQGKYISILITNQVLAAALTGKAWGWWGSKGAQSLDDNDNDNEITSVPASRLIRTQHRPSKLFGQRL